MATTIKTLQDVINWLQPIQPGDTVAVSAAMFDAVMVTNVLDTVANTDSLSITVTEVSPSADHPSLTGKTSIFDEPESTVVFIFSQPASALLLTLNFNLPAATTWQLIPAFNFYFGNIGGGFIPDEELEVISLLFACDVVAGTHQPIHIPVSMTVPTYEGDWTITGSFSELGNLTEDIIYAIAGDNQVTSILPEKISKEIDKFYLKNFEVSFNPSEGTCEFIRLLFSYKAQWSFFGDLFVVEDINLDYEIFNPVVNGTSTKDYHATLFANMKMFEGFSFRVGGQFPDKVVFAQLQPEHPLMLTKVFEFLKIPLPENFPDIEISTFAVTYYTVDGGYDFTLAITKPIPLAGAVYLDNASFDLGANYDDNTKKMLGYGSLYTSFTIGSTMISLGADYNEGQGVNMTGEVNNLPIGELITTLLDKFKITEYPEFIHNIILVKLKVTYSTGSGDFSFNCTGHFPLADNSAVDIEVTLTVKKTLTGTGYDKNVHAQGKLTYQQQTYTLDFTKNNTRTSFAAAWENKGTPLGIKSIAGMLGMQDDVPEIPEDLDLGLNGAAFVYDNTEAQPLFILAASSANYGGAVFAAVKTTGKWVFYFGMATGKVIDLSNLPIIDKLTSPSNTAGTLSIEALHVDIASATIDGTIAKLINEKINEYAPSATTYPTIPGAGMLNRVAFSMTLNIGTTKLAISLGGDGKNNGNTAAHTTYLDTIQSKEDPDHYSVVATPTIAESPVFWYNLQKNFGPLYFEKIGLTYKDSRIFILVDVSATAGGLTISLNGFGISLPIKNFDTAFTISGIGITFASGPLLISGGLNGSFSPVNLVGQVFIKTTGLTIGALGGYTEVEGHPSLFIFAVLNYPIGGPPYFFVTGLAAGFGFNRSLVIPGITGVETFPFVQWAMGTDNPPVVNPTGNIGQQVNAVMKRIVDDGIVAPSVGNNWLAAGIRFTSFEMLDSFALLTIAFGSDFEIALLGLSRLVLPPGAGKIASAPIIVYAELALKASFSTKTGLIGVQGQLTSSSYVLSKDCHITGGFAFYLWVGDQHFGEFVVTLGGYNPNYRPPDYYPVVPRLGMNWKVSSNLTVKGGQYFALTSNAAMAGGYLDAVWQSGSIKAWFSLQADFLIMWKPFYYDIRASISIGASFSINLWFTTLDMTIHVGATLHIWGPEFSGEATVDLSIISFTISFGAAGKRKQQTISWPEFAKDMLPQKNSQARRLRRMESDTPDDTANPDVCKIIISDGLITELSSKEGELNWIVNAEKFKLSTQSVIPSKNWTFSSNISLDPDDPNYHTDPNKDFGIRPTATAATGLSSEHIIRITSTEDSTFHAGKTLSNVAKALWQPVPFDTNGNPIIGDPVKNTTLEKVLTGFSIFPFVTPPDHLFPINLQALQFDTQIEHFSWSDPYVTKSDTFAAQPVARSITSTRAVDNRDLLVKTILENGLSVNPSIQVNVLANPADEYLLAEPVLRLLGEEK